MTPEQSQLWKNIQDFEFDNPKSDFKFSDRLAREKWVEPTIHGACY
jgi:hypothetical protein